MSEVRLPEWLTPPPDGFTADDLDRLSDLPPHTELIDGSLVFVSPQVIFHMLALRILEHAVLDQAPAEWAVRREMSLKLGERQRPEPDLMVVRAESQRDFDRSYYLPADVLLVVEVVSGESQIRDRERKPQLYARAGIRHFWRVEREDGNATVYVYELDPALRAYTSTGIYRDRLKLNVPFPIDVDLDRIHYAR